jgi:hypothetical protein
MGKASSFLGQQRWETAFTGIETLDNILIPTALARGDIHRSDHLHNPIGMGTIADEIAEAIDLVRMVAIDIAEDRIEGFVIAVDTGNDSEFHGEDEIKEPNCVGCVVPTGNASA